jgi:hypothetical protein
MFYVFCKNAKKEFNFKENPRFSFDLSLFKENLRFSFDLSLLLAKLYQVIYKKKIYTIEELKLDILILRWSGIGNDLK